MKTLTLEPKYSFQEAAKKKGEWITEDDFSILIEEDCDAYDEEGNPLFFFRKNAIPTNLCRDAYYVLRHAATPTNNRGAAGGIISEETKRDWNIGEESKVQIRLRKKDGTISFCLLRYDATGCTSIVCRSGCMPKHIVSITT